eukprot:GHVN01006536.1.p1 GENE.GHVN01006536.1~~GHVN01006536.1.p1  ORF type:complete len:211 (-),score=47.64 GHVN01006536.1:225-857(-)
MLLSIFKFHILSAESFDGEVGVVVAEMDASEEVNSAVAQRFGVKGFPTLILFSNGQVKQTFDEGRTLPVMVEWLNTHTGSNRLPGGGFKTDQGRVTKIEEVIANGIEKHCSDSQGECISKLVKEVEAMGDNEAEKMEMKPYYVKALLRIKEDLGWVEQEYGRLEKIISKGDSLTLEKKASAIARHNILSHMKDVAKQVVENVQGGAHSEL